MTGFFDENENVTLYEDECYSSIVDEAELIVLSLNLDDGNENGIDVNVLISSEESVGNIGTDSKSEDGFIPSRYTFLAILDAEYNDFDQYACEKNSTSTNGRRQGLVRTRRTLGTRNPQLLGPRIRYMSTTLLNDEQKSKIPTSWDWRNNLTNAAASTALSQGSCGSCYTFGGITAMAYRYISFFDAQSRYTLRL
jgi:hypothetical protein